MKKLKRKNESGVLVVEAAIVVTVVTMFIAVMLYIGMFLYQQSLVTIMANQTASNVAQVYGNTLRDTFTGYVDADGVHETVTYTNLRNSAYMDVIEQKANAFALYRLKSSRILTTGETEVEVEVVPKSNELLKDQIVVTVSDSYEIPLVSFFGVTSNKLRFIGTGRADCADLLEYLTGVPALGDPDGNAVAFSYPTECTVNFYKHRGDSRPLKTVTVLRGNSVSGSNDWSNSTMPAKPTQEKMRFTKWITERGNIFTADSIVNENMNVYGSWECTVTFDPDGGKVDPSSMIATVTGNITPPFATRDNCTFAGWYTKKNGEGEEFTGVNVQGDITVYAKWVCNVFFDPDGGTVFPDTVELVYGKTLKQAGYTLPTPSRTGCAFAGWFTQRCGEGTNYTVDTPINGDTNLSAKWSCSILLDGNGGSVNKQTSATFNVVVGKMFSIPHPVRGQSNTGKDGWRFISWNSQKDGSGNSYTTEIQVNGPTTLYAQWNCLHKDANGVSRYTAGDRMQYLCRTDAGGPAGSEKSYQVYVCVDCGDEFRETIPNKHYINPVYLVNTHEFLGTDVNLNDFTGTCNVDHLTTPYEGVSGTYESGFYTKMVYHKYHITCRYCGMPCPKVHWNNIDNTSKYDYIYWVGTPEDPITECRDPGFRYN